MEEQTTYVFPLWLFFASFYTFLSEKCPYPPAPYFPRFLWWSCVIVGINAQETWKQQKKPAGSVGYEGWAVIPHTSLLQIPFGGVLLVKRKPVFCKCLDQSEEKRACVRVGFSNRRVWLCSHTAQSPPPAGESLPESPHCSFVSLWAWLSYPQHLLYQGLSWASCWIALVLLPAELGAVRAQGLAGAAGPGLKT